MVLVRVNLTAGTRLSVLEVVCRTERGGKKNERRSFSNAWEDDKLQSIQLTSPIDSDDAKGPR